jgi:dihydroorotate dehydrogenase
MYRLVRRALFSVEPEKAHSISLSMAQLAHRLHLLSGPGDESASASVMGLRFPNRIGLAAGFDKNGRYVDALGSLGFGFVEVGTVTPRPQAGQPLPRLFRIPEAGALINRMGFPNEGASAVAARLAHRRFKGVCGVNIGKNAATPNDRAIDDYVACFRALAPCADYIAVNVSSPNTQDLRRLQGIDYLQPILEALLAERDALTVALGRRVPVLTKISPDLPHAQLLALAHLMQRLRMDGVIATNTTVTRPEVVEGSLGMEQGGLSGAPLHPFALRAVRTLRSVLAGQVAIIGVGGIACVADAIAMREAGADLLQIYTGMVYCGPALIAQIGKALR